MSSQALAADTEHLRDQLMARDPMQRFMALHLLEVQAESGTAAKLAGQVEAFAARGVPYYAPNDPHYQAWVGRALDFWRRLHTGSAD
jgi:hypothetical protein